METSPGPRDRSAETSSTWQPLGFRTSLCAFLLGPQRDVLTLVIEVKCFLYLSSYTYEVSPVFLLVEEAVLKKMIECVGWKEGDGIFNPGEYLWRPPSPFHLEHLNIYSVEQPLLADLHMTKKLTYRGADTFS